MKSLKEQLIYESNGSTEFTFHGNQMMLAYAGLQCLYNYDTKEAILEEIGMDEDDLDILIEDLQDEINNNKKCDAIIKQCIRYK